MINSSRGSVCIAEGIGGRPPNLDAIISKAPVIVLSVALILFLLPRARAGKPKLLVRNRWGILLRLLLFDDLESRLNRCSFFSESLPSRQALRAAVRPRCEAVVPCLVSSKS